MTLYYYMYRSWQDCCRTGENRSWPSVSVESVDSEYWCLNNAVVYAFIMRLTVEERVYGPLLSWTLCIIWRRIRRAGSLSCVNFSSIRLMCCGNVTPHFDCPIYFNIYGLGVRGSEQGFGISPCLCSIFCFCLIPYLASGWVRSLLLVSWYFPS